MLFETLKQFSLLTLLKIKKIKLKKSAKKYQTIVRNIFWYSTLAKRCLWQLKFIFIKPIHQLRQFKRPFQLFIRGILNSRL